MYPLAHIPQIHERSKGLYLLHNLLRGVPTQGNQYKDFQPSRNIRNGCNSPPYIYDKENLPQHIFSQRSTFGSRLFYLFRLLLSGKSDKE